jgi:hypothetical protein
LTSAYAPSPSCPTTHGAWPAPATLTSAVSRSQCVQNDCSMRWGRVIVRTPTIACEERAFAVPPAAPLAAGFHAISATTTGCRGLIQGRSWPTRPSLSGLRELRSFHDRVTGGSNRPLTIWPLASASLFRPMTFNRHRYIAAQVRKEEWLVISRLRMPSPTSRHPSRTSQTPVLRCGCR